MESYFITCLFAADMLKEALILAECTWHTRSARVVILSWSSWKLKLRFIPFPCFFMKEIQLILRFM